MKRIASLWLAVALTAALFATPAAAEESRYLRAERAAAKGRMLIRAGEVPRGVAFLREAQRIAPDPRYVLEEAQALEEVRQLSKALLAFESYRDTGIEGRELALVDAHITDLRMRLASTHAEVLVNVTPVDAEVYLDRVAPGSRIDPSRPFWVRGGDHALIVQQEGFVPTRLSFVVNPGGTQQEVAVALEAVAEKATLIVRANRRDAAVFIDGVEQCRVPCERRLAPGTYLVRVEHRGAQAVQQLVRLTAGATLPIDAMLKAGGTTTLAPEIIAVQPEVPTTGPEEPAPFELPPEIVPERSRLLGTMGWVTFGVGLAAAATGGVFNYLTFAKADEANGLDPARPDYDSKFDDLKSETELNGLLSTALYAAGGALVVGGITMIVIDAVRGDDSGQVTVISPGPAPGGGLMLQTQTRF